ncbi:MAG: cation-translocating P-type ATPase [Muribaculaceae bacterium]|nr:cation-translocating P-type ATPase [Roseburia sp.]MCM1430306.1 cation-translocating P-type ATPase [Muribaculaceae bacterium]MCM1492498.1 cation-translocating P-type ATPase [Muribaculaceae bacterium]
MELEQKQTKLNNAETQEMSLERIAADPAVGLTAEQVQARLAAHADNCKVDSSTKTVSEIIKSNLLTYFNLVFAIIAVLLIVVGAWTDMLFLPVIIANTCIGIVQELHSKKVLDRLSILNAPRCTAVRDGQEVILPPEELVLDDIVKFSAGSQIPADAVIVSGEVQVNESLITGEADEISKKSGDSLLSGSFVVSGSAYARLEKVGRNSYISKLTLQATKSKKGEQSEMIRSLNYLIMVMGIIIIPIGIALFVQSFIYNEGTLHDSVTSMVAAIIGMIPEGLYLLASVALAVSVVRLSKKKVLVHDMKCIETLARVSVLCVDKTGTITEPGMHVYEFETLDGLVPEETFALLSDLAAAQAKDNATMEALQAHFTKGTGAKATEVFSFSSETKFSGAVIGGKSYVIGAPEFVLRGQTAEYQEQIDAYSSKGYRVLVFGEYEGKLTKKPLTEPVTPMGFVMLANPIRSGAKKTFGYFVENGVEIKVISGDNPLTVSVIAAEAGIKNADRYVDAATLKTKNDFYKAVEEYTVFGRVTPNQKRMLVQALKAHKKTVAMTGDGVNDVLALKDADCSVAMASGSDAASNVSQLVLMDSDFARMPSVVAEGRRVVNNIQRTASLYIVKNIFSMLLAIFSVILMLDYPLEPSQVTLISMFTIGIPSFILALEPNRELISGHFLTNVLVKALPAGLTDFLVVSALVLFCREFSVDPECLSTSCTILVAVVGFMILYRIASPMRGGHIFMMAGLVGGWLFCMLFVNRLFAITAISRQCAMLMAVFAIITEPCLRYLSLLVEWIYAKIRALRKKFAEQA